jgi:hypothetical protein
VRVPDNAGNGVAKVTLSMPNWKEKPVTPLTLDIPIQDATLKAAPPKR